jgi:hypothetical protein
MSRGDGWVQRACLEALRAHEESYPGGAFFIAMGTADIARKVYQPLAERQAAEALAAVQAKAEAEGRWFHEPPAFTIRPPTNAETAAVSRALHLLRAKGRVEVSYNHDNRWYEDGVPGEGWVYGSRWSLPDAKTRVGMERARDGKR